MKQNQNITYAEFSTAMYSTWLFKGYSSSSSLLLLRLCISLQYRSCCGYRSFATNIPKKSWSQMESVRWNSESMLLELRGNWQVLYNPDLVRKQRTRGGDQVSWSQSFWTIVCKDTKVSISFIGTESMKDATCLTKKGLFLGHIDLQGCCTLQFLLLFPSESALHNGPAVLHGYSPDDPQRCFGVLEWPVFFSLVRRVGSPRPKP